MKKLVTVVPNVHVQLALCCSAAVLLSACGGGTADIEKDQPTQIAAQSYHSDTSMSASALPTTDDSPPGTTIPSGTPPDSGAPIEPAYDSPAPATIPSGAQAASDTDTDESTRLLANATVVPVSIYHLYVATTGSDANPGTQAAPLKTIARADALARAGSTIHGARYL